MPVTKEQVLEHLAKVPSPDGTPLPATGALSEIVASDNKVFLLNVDAGAVQAWERCASASKKLCARFRRDVRPRASEGQ